MLGSLGTRYRVGEPQRAEGMVGNRYLQDDAAVQNREHGRLPKGWQGERQGVTGKRVTKHQGPTVS